MDLMIADGGAWKLQMPDPVAITDFSLMKTGNCTQTLDRNGSRMECTGFRAFTITQHLHGPISTSSLCLLRTRSFMNCTLAPSHRRGRSIRRLRNLNTFANWA